MKRLILQALVTGVGLLWVVASPAGASVAAMGEFSCSAVLELSGDKWKAYSLQYVAGFLAGMGERTKLPVEGIYEYAISLCSEGENKDKAFGWAVGEAVIETKNWVK